MKYSLFALAVVFAAVLSHSVQAVTISSSTHPTLVTHDFAAGNIPFTPYQREGGVASGARFNAENGVLTITNDHAGSFGIDTKTAPFDAEKFSRVYFDYALSSDVKVNIFFRHNGIYHGVVFSGPKDVRAGGVLLGSIENVVADGKWHRAEIPLREWLRKLYPTKGQLMVDEVIIGNWDNSNYLMAGIGGNGPGAQWQLDDFTIAGVGPTEAKFSIIGEGGAAIKPDEYSWSLNDGPAAPLSSSELSLSAAEGLQVLQILDKAKKPVAGYGFVVSASAPQIGKLELAGNTLRVPIRSNAGLDWASLKLTVGERAFQLDSPFLSWDGGTGVLALQAAAAGLQWNNGQQIPVTLEGVRDVLGRDAAVPKLALAMDFNAHKSAPPAPDVLELIAMGDGSFETSLDEWSPKAGSESAAIVERDREAPARGEYSVRLTAPSNAAIFAASIRRSPFDAAKFPVIEFHYKIPPELRVDFLLNWGNRTVSVGFTDRTPQHPRIGEIANVVADGKWHQARLPLYEMMRKHRPDAPDFIVNWLSLEDSGWLGNAKGTTYWIDEFRFVPVVKGSPFQSKIAMPDVTGVQGISWVLDETPSTDPPAQSKGKDALSVSGSGAKWLHVRAQNGAGVWSESTHVPLVLDSTPPQIAEPVPARGAKTSAEVLQIPLKDDVALDLSSIALSVQGREYTLKDADLLRFEGDALNLDLENAIARGRMTALADGAKVSWQLKPVRDAAGHSAPEAGGEWNHDFASDKNGPDITPASSTHLAHLRDDFDADNNPNPPPVIAPDDRRRWRFRNFRPQGWQGFWTGENVNIQRGKRTPDNAENQTLRAVPAAANTAFALRLVRGWDVAQFPLLGFAYKVPVGSNLYLRFRTSKGQLLSVKFIGTTSGKVIGEIPGAVADNTWRWATLNLGALKDKLGDNQIQMFELVDSSAKWPADTPFEIDDFIVQKAPEGNIKVTWKATDISGVQNYRVAWDQKPDTAPTEVTTKTSDELKPGSGMWWLHVQAQDGAGNWGPISHLPILQP